MTTYTFIVCNSLPGQTVEIWHGDDPIWLDLKEGIEIALEDLPGVQLHVYVNYRNLQHPDANPADYVAPTLGNNCLFVFGRDGYDIAHQVLDIVRREDKALQAAIEAVQ